ncbi:MAG: anti-sigma factor family protein [Myxococcales bacterium]
MTRRVPGELSCAELVELVTDYLEGALPRADRRRFEKHIAACENCTAYIEQIRLTIAAAGELTEADIEPEAREALLDAFRDWKTER